MPLSEATTRSDAPAGGRGGPSPHFAGRPNDRIGPQGLGISGLCGFAAAWAVTRALGVYGHDLIVLWFLAGTALPMVILSLWVVKTPHRATTGLRREGRNKPDFVRVATKLLGLAATIGGLAAAYWLFPEYSRTFYAPVWQVFLLVLFPVAVFTVFYFFWVDRRMADPYDAYWQLGRLLLGLGRGAAEGKGKPGAIKTHLLAWTVKGFFLPLMIAGAARWLPRLLNTEISLHDFVSLYTGAVSLIFSIDVTFAAVGYILTLRPLDSHVRSVEPTWAGWLCAIICYLPFANIVWGSFLHYRGRGGWQEWLAGSPGLFVVWGVAILGLFLVYGWATVSFGCRFSNLTHRGILTEGPYRFCRHPAYLAKNLGWWLMYVPFAAHAHWPDALKGCLGLLLTNLLYLARAKTEERHLMADPAYVEYSAWMARNGLWARVRGLLPGRGRGL